MDLQYYNDITIEKGDLVMVDGANETAQRIRDRLLTFRGEWFLDLLFGPDYRNDILIKNYRINVVSAIIKKEILKSEDGEFTKFEASFVDRKLSLSYEFIGADGPVVDQVVI